MPISVFNPATVISGDEQTFTAATEWTFTHNRDSYPSVVCINEDGISLKGGNIEYPSRNSIIVRFNSPLSGKMRVI